MTLEEFSEQLECLAACSRGSGHSFYALAQSWTAILKAIEQGIGREIDYNLPPLDPEAIEPNDIFGLLFQNEDK